jgi:heat shock protein HslJ
MKQFFCTGWLIVPFCFIITSYQPSGPVTPVKTMAAVADPELNGEWFLQPVLPSDTAAGKLPWIKFNTSKDSFTGNDGCNDSIGSFSNTDTTLGFISISAVTQQTCPGFNEREFIENLRLVNSYRVKEAVLELLFDQTVLSGWNRDKKNRKK